MSPNNLREIGCFQKIVVSLQHEICRCDIALAFGGILHLRRSRGNGGAGETRGARMGTVGQEQEVCGHGCEMSWGKA